MVLEGREDTTGRRRHSSDPSRAPPRRPEDAEPSAAPPGITCAGRGGAGGLGRASRAAAAAAARGTRPAGKRRRTGRRAARRCPPAGRARQRGSPAWGHEGSQCPPSPHTSLAGARALGRRWSREDRGGGGGWMLVFSGVWSQRCANPNTGQPRPEPQKLIFWASGRFVRDIPKVPQTKLQAVPKHCPHPTPRRGQPRDPKDSRPSGPRFAPSVKWACAWVGPAWAPAAGTSWI